MFGGSFMVVNLLEFLSRYSRYRWITVHRARSREKSVPACSKQAISAVCRRRAAWSKAGGKGQPHRAELSRAANALDNSDLSFFTSSGFAFDLSGGRSDSASRLLGGPLSEVASPRAG